MRNLAEYRCNYAVKLIAEFGSADHNSIKNQIPKLVLRLPNERHLDCSSDTNTKWNEKIKTKFYIQNVCRRTRVVIFNLINRCQYMRAPLIEYTYYVIGSI